MTYTLAEQETTVTVSRADDLVHVYTTNPAHIRSMSKDERFTVGEVGHDGVGDFGRFTIPAENWHPVRGAKSRRTLTDEQKAAAADRLTAARAARKVER